MSLKTVQSKMIRPAEDTPRGRIWLSKLDMIIRTPNSHTNIFLIYDSPQASKYMDANVGIAAISKILVPFYPLAGRLKMNADNNRYEIDCNAEGALCVEAETNKQVADLGEVKPSGELRKLILPECDYSRDVSLIPLLMVQITRFKCGGIALAFALHHHVADGNALGFFLYSWLRVFMGQDLIIPPVHDRVLYLAPRNPPLVKFRHSEFDQILPSLPPSLLPGHNNETMQSVFKLSEAQINVLKQQVKDTNKNLTTYEVVAAHVWRSACKARNLPHDQEVKLYIPVDGRLTLQNPNIPFGYFGNVLFFSSCILKASDVMFKPLGFISSKIHEAVKKMHDVEYLRSAIDYLESEPGLPVPLMGIHKTMFPNLLVNSWVKLPVQIADFGFGLPKVFGNVEIKLEGLSFLVPRTDEEDESLALAINLFAVHMPMFEKHLYEFNHIKSSL